jgi:hypothetical protein
MTRRRLDIKIQRREYENDGKTVRRHDVYVRMTYMWMTIDTMQVNYRTFIELDTRQLHSKMHSGNALL